MKCIQCKKEYNYNSEDLKLLQELSPQIGGKTYDLPQQEKCYREEVY